MPNIKSAKKRVIVTATKTAQNRMAKTAFKTELKKFAADIAAADDKQAVVNAAYKAVDQACANEVIDIVEDFAKEAYEETGTHFVFASDEMYMVAQRPLPAYEYYEDFPQIENGVGLCVQLVDTYEYAKQRYGTCPIPRRVTMATGQSAAGFLRSVIGEEDMVQIVPIKNKFFGESITVAGLVTGGDLIEQLKGMDLCEELLIPSCMLRSEGDLFLDNVPIEAVEQELHVKTTVVAVDGEALYCALHGIRMKEEEEE